MRSFAVLVTFESVRGTDTALPMHHPKANSRSHGYPVQAMWSRSRGRSVANTVHTVRKGRPSDWAQLSGHWTSNIHGSEEGTRAMDHVM